MSPSRKLTIESIWKHSTVSVAATGARKLLPGVGPGGLGTGGSWLRGTAGGSSRSSTQPLSQGCTRRTRAASCPAPGASERMGEKGVLDRLRKPTPVPSADGLLRRGLQHTLFRACPTSPRSLETSKGCEKYEAKLPSVDGECSEKKSAGQISSKAQLGARSPNPAERAPVFFHIQGKHSGAAASSREGFRGGVEAGGAGRGSVDLLER
ncbi:PREDICTED: uncharacterized protein LOC102013390 isoform X2 [Chinchilla lanigera]|uniref:uncharacterized protein LOC102013390 isoform X2 n=1 Tax=Chinchilla lanigera TaxID=34839 RepID=UPI00038EF7CC|nr:PREDICTED: uncharacterized protein LOC102013390 isoform X2 [Chinchilla lanigera]